MIVNVCIVAFGGSAFGGCFVLLNQLGQKQPENQGVFLFALMDHQSNYKVKTCFNRSCEQFKPTRNSQALTKNSKRFVRPVEANTTGKSGRFLTSRVTNLITKSKRFEIGRIKNLNQSETIFIGFGGNPDRGKWAGRH